MWVLPGFPEKKKKHKGDAAELAGLRFGLAPWGHGA